MAAQAVSVGTALGAREWSGLRPADPFKAAPAAARADTQIGVSKKGRVVQMTLSVEKKQFTTKKSEETFAAAKVSAPNSLLAFPRTLLRESSCYVHLEMNIMTFVSDSV